MFLYQKAIAGEFFENLMRKTLVPLVVGIDKIINKRSIH